MGILQKKCRITGKKALAYRGKGGQNTDIAFLALRLGVVLHLLNLEGFKECTMNTNRLELVSALFTQTRLEPLMLLELRHRAWQRGPVMMDGDCSQTRCNYPMVKALTTEWRW